VPPVKQHRIPVLIKVKKVVSNRGIPYARPSDFGMLGDAAARVARNIAAEMPVNIVPVIKSIFCLKSSLSIVYYD